MPVTFSLFSVKLTFIKPLIILLKLILLNWGYSSLGGIAMGLAFNRTLTKMIWCYVSVLGK